MTASERGLTPLNERPYAAERAALAHYYRLFGGDVTAASGTDAVHALANEVDLLRRTLERVEEQLKMNVSSASALSILKVYRSR